jgi:hypothetical protein
MFKYLISAFFVFYLGSISAQNFIPDINKLHPAANAVVVEDTLRILGVMVSFQEDRDASTFGNGKFGSIYTQDYGNKILDPLPHDKSYFESHLEFVKNYYRKVSGDKLVIEYYILPDTFSVSKTMRNYSPPQNSNDFSLIASFAQEAWLKADSINPRFDFSHYDLFSIFHAGVGRDITLPGSLGNERDLPSVYLGINTLKGIYGNEFEGFELPNNNFSIPNTMIIPETESRELTSFSNIFLFEITINGLIAANIASHIGLPDLFDTNTGLSAIGRFGLMDGQSIFAYNGVFPPEPSAWEKIFLGWADAVEVEPGNYDINVVTKLAASIGDTVILKIPLSASEYFLVENRIRDVNNDGAVLKYVLGRDTLVKSYDKDTTGFYSFAVDSVDGVVIDVDEFDWAVPGNGLVIWHIDDNIIQEKISENKINTDKAKRGVDVEEADGIQDIGEKFLTIFGDEVIGEGTEQDFWFVENEADLYENIFNKDSRPDTRSNEGANSLITLKDFSTVSSRMNLKVVYGDSLITPVFNIELSGLNPDENKLTVTDSSGTPGFGILSDSTLNLINEDGVLQSVIPSMSIFKPVSFTSGGNNYFVGTLTSGFRVYQNGNPLTSLISVEGRITAPPVIRKTPTEEYDLLIGTSASKVYIYNLSQLPTGSPVLRDSLVLPENHSILRIAADGFYISAVGVINGTDYLTVYDGNYIYSLPAAEFNDFGVTKDQIGEYVSILMTKPNGFNILSGGSIRTFEALTDSLVTSFSIADIKQDGQNYIIYCANHLYAVNLNGVLADNFPFKDPSGIGFEGLPLASDFAGDERSEIIAYTKDGRLFAVDGGSGKLVTGFPLATGGKLSSVPAIFNQGGKTSLAALNNKNYFFTWSISSVPGTGYWMEASGNNMNSSFIGPASSTAYVNYFLPVDRAYNYPNPVYDGHTFIRYYVSETSKINIKIFDLAGDFVAELNDDASAGTDNETTWDVNNIQSGIYLARIEATSTGGRSESTIIKIAVVK